MTARDAMAAARRVTALTGAGVSTASGLPDFGSAALRRAFDLAAYLADERLRADAWRAWTAMLAAEPNPAHRALTDLQRSGRLRSVLTQNVDGLHQRAGTTGVVELHGSVREVVCLSCGRRGAFPPSPDCGACGGVLRPSTVAFGEPLDPAVLRSARTAVLDCDLLLVAGTSLGVEPAAGLVALAARAGAVVVVCNGEPTPFDAVAEVVRGPVEDTLPALVAVPSSPSDRPVRTWGDPSTW
ncbi:Sir2 family NAD-dependent protein deacetylase [Actinosynnema sp. NPDC020468]|uniref:SIR2 family NAD-dependent protein deacylase n=1 Tax=Actinosynnema sp. NPDC020468 TaxID=3154488 RepID=UPI0033C7B7B8